MQEPAYPMTTVRSSGNVMRPSPVQGCIRKIYLCSKNRWVESLALDLVSGLHPFVPAVHGSGDQPAPWLDLQFLHGEVPDISDCDVAADVGTQLGVLVRRMHVETRGRCARIPQRNICDLLNTLPLLARWVKTTIISEFLKSEKRRIAPSPTERCLLHRDLRVANVLYSFHEGTVYLLDFENACAGPFEGDLARLLFFEHTEAPFFDSFISSYGIQRNELLEIRRVHVPVFAIEMFAWLARRQEKEDIKGELTDRLVAILEKL